MTGQGSLVCTIKRMVATCLAAVLVSALMSTMVLAQAFAGQSAPPLYTTHQIVPSLHITRQSAPALPAPRAVPAQTVPAQAVQTQAVPAQAAQTQAVQTQTAQVQTVQAQAAQPVLRITEETTQTVIEDSVFEEIAEYEAALEAQGVPRFGLPLFAPKGFDTWALANLVLVVLALLLALVSGGFAVWRSRQQRSLPIANAHAREFVRLPFIGAAATLSVANLTLFLVAQESSLPPVLFDWWSLTFVALLLTQLVLIRLALPNKPH